MAKCMSGMPTREELERQFGAIEELEERIGVKKGRC